MTAIKADALGHVSSSSHELLSAHLKNGFDSRISYACFSAPAQSPPWAFLMISRRSL